MLEIFSSDNGSLEALLTSYPITNIREIVPTYLEGDLQAIHQPC